MVILNQENNVQYENNNYKAKNYVPIWQKAALTIEEASTYSNIGICKLNELAKKPNCPFVLYIGKKKLIKRDKFEKYISDAIEI